MNFSSENTVNAGSMFHNTVGTTINFSGGPQLLWSTAITMKYDVKDTYLYHLRGTTSVGRNTAMKHQSYFYTTAGFDPDMAKQTEQYLAKIDNLVYRYKITNYVLKAMSMTYKLMNKVDSAAKVIKQPVGTWTESTRQALQKGTSGVVYSLDKMRAMINLAEGWLFKSGFWKNFVRNDFQPHAIAQVSSTKGVFLGAQYENSSREGERTTAALYLDNSIRLRASSTPAEKAAHIFYPRDVQPQGTMKPWDWISPDKVITEIKAKQGYEPTEYAAFNGFKVPVDSSVDIGPAGIDSLSATITSQALNHVQKSVTQAVLEHKAAQSLADEIKVKLEIAKKQVLALQGIEGEGIVPISPAEMAMAPLVAAAKAADKTQKMFLLAEAILLMNKLLEDYASAQLTATNKKTQADMPAAKAFSELKTSHDFFDLTHESGQSKASVRGSTNSLSLVKNDAEVFLSDDLVSVTVDDSSSGLVATKDHLELMAGGSGVKVTNDGLTIKGGGSEIELANNSVTIGDLKITQVGGNTKLNLLDQSEEKISSLEKKFETLSQAFDRSIEEKNIEIQALKEQVANLGKVRANPKKKGKS